MSKSVLIIDTPSHCAECDLYCYENNHAICYPEYIMKDMFAKTQDFDPFTMRMPECPLVSMEHFIQKTKEVLEEEYNARN